MLFNDKFKKNSSLAWVEMNFNVPIEEIFNEYCKIKHFLVEHRSGDGHKDWYAITLFGINSISTKSHWEYGIKSKKNITDIGKECPKTLSWVYSLPYKRIDDIRFLVIKPNGYITEHVDVKDQNWLDPLNISITYPTGTEFRMNNEIVPYEAGTSMILNIHYPHKVINNSPLERLHLLVHGKKNEKFWNFVKRYK